MSSNLQKHEESCLTVTLVLDLAGVYYTVINSWAYSKYGNNLAHKVGKSLRTVFNI